MSGVRLALVQVWATATIAALVAGPGLGRVITDGFFRTNYGKGIAGAVVVAAGRAGPRAARGGAAAALAHPGPRVVIRNVTPGNVGGPALRLPRRPTPSRSLSSLIRTRVAPGHGTQKEHHVDHDVHWPRSSPSAPSSSPPLAPVTTSTRRLGRREQPRRDLVRLRSAPTSAGGPVTLAGQSFPEAALVAAMYEQLLEKAGYDVDHQAGRLPRRLHGDLPRQRRHRARVRRRHRQLPQRPGTATTPRRSRPATAPSSPSTARPLLDAAGITLLDQSAGDRHQRVHGHQGVLRGRTASPSSPTSRARASCSPPPPTARAGSTARAACPTSTASTSPRCCRSATPATRPTSR